MQVHQSLAWATPILAFCLSLLLGVVLLPSLGLVNYTQFDFWLLWFGSMLVLSLPLLILEIALAKRVKNVPLPAFVQLTREADRSTQWRLMSWVAVFFAVFLAGGMLNHAVQQWLSYQAMGLSAASWLLLSMVLAIALSMLPRSILLLLTSLACCALLYFSFSHASHPAWYWSPIEFAEWGKVVILSVVIGGLGFGLYWQNALEFAKNQQKTMPIVLPIWAAQVVALALLSVIGDMTSPLQALSFVIAAIGMAALLIQFSKEQLQQRQLGVVIQALGMVIPLLLWVIPQSVLNLNQVIILIALLLCLSHAIFVGWLMKISHLRKAINFSSELSYNLWRVMIRIILPLAIVLALVAWLPTWTLA